MPWMPLFMTIHLASGKSTFINFREKAPLAAHADMFLDSRGNPIGDESVNGFLAAGVPGTVMGLETARQEYGTMPRSTLMAAAIRLECRAAQELSQPCIAAVRHVGTQIIRVVAGG